MKLSVVMMTYYHEKFIRRALDSVLGQSFDEYEIVVSDDSSKDNTLEILDQYKEEYGEKIKVLKNEENKGITFNLCKAILHASGEYIVLVSGDDYLIDKDKFEKQVRFLDENEDFYAVATIVKSTNDSHKHIFGVYPDKVFWGTEFTRQDWIEGNILPTHGIMFRNVFRNEANCEKLMKVKEFSRYLDDFTFVNIIFDFGKVYVLDEITYVYETVAYGENFKKSYNALYEEDIKCIDKINVVKNVQKYYKGKYDLYQHVSNNLNNYVKKTIIRGSWTDLKILKGIPISWIISTLIGVQK